jgi:TrmH family RNA methyltransferase
MITKAQIQFIRSLEQKRARNESGCFLVEGEKLVREALKLPSIGNFQVKAIYGIESWLDSNVSEWADYKSVVTPVTSGVQCNKR